MVVRILKNHPAGPAQLSDIRLQVGVNGADRQLAALQRQQSIEMPRQSGFSTAVVTDNGDEFSGSNGKSSHGRDWVFL